MQSIRKFLKAITAILTFLSSLFTKDGLKAIGHFVANQLQAVVVGAEEILTAAQPYLQPIEQAFVSAFKQYGIPIVTDIQAALADVIQPVLSVSETALTNHGPSTPANSDTVAADALVDAFGFGLASAGVTALFEAAFPEKLNTLNGVGPMLAQLAGFKEVSEHVRNPLYRAAFGRSLEYKYNSTFKPDFLDAREAARLFARGLITQDQLTEALTYTALKTEYNTAISQAGYNPVSPRALASAFVDVNFPETQVMEMMQFAGNRPQDITVMVEAFKERSSQNVRQEYLSALVAATEQGDMTTDQLNSALQNLNFSTDAIGLVQLTVATKRLQQLTTLYRKSISEGYKYGSVTDADYVTQLEAIGINSADAQAHYAVDSIAKHGRDAQAAARAEATAEAKQQRAAVAAAQAQFRAGSIDAVALGAELAAAGLPAALVVYAVAVATARQNGAQRLVYGQLLAPADAEVLRGQVAAIGEQVYKKLLAPADAIAQLANLKVPGNIREAIVAKYAAEAGLPILPA